MGSTTTNEPDAVCCWVCSGRIDRRGVSWRCGTCGKVMCWACFQSVICNCGGPDAGRRLAAEDAGSSDE